MRHLILIASIALVGTAVADEAPKSATADLDTSSPRLLKSSDSEPASAARAQDYNSSRSNTTALREDTTGDLDRDGRPDIVTCGNGVDNDCDDTSQAAQPGDYNGTRSNRSGVASPRNHNASRSNRSSGTRAQDYNSSRSNNSSARLDPDSDGDSTLDEVRCSKASDDCVTQSGGEDPVLRKRPGKK